MKLMRCNSSTGNASWGIGYLLRQEETGIILTTDIMQSDEFRAAIKHLQADQKEAFNDGNMRMSHDLRDRRKQLLESASENSQFCGTSDVRNLAKLVHDMDLTMMFNREGRHFKMLTEPIPLPDVDDPEAVEKILKSAEAVRDLFPKNLPGVFTIHTKGDKTPISIEEAIRLRKNIHVQALLATKTFKDGAWNSPYQQLSPKKGDDHLIAELAEKVEKAVSGVIGRSFKKHTEVVVDENGTRTRVATDPDRPVRTTYSTAAAAIIGRYTNQQLRNLPLESIRNRSVRQEISQVLAIDAYDRSLKNTKSGQMPVDRFNDLFASVGGNIYSAAAIPPVPGTSFSAFIAIFEERRAYAGAVSRQLAVLSDKEMLNKFPEQSTPKLHKCEDLIQKKVETVRLSTVDKSNISVERIPIQHSKESRDAAMLKEAMKSAETRNSLKRSKILSR